MIIHQKFRSMTYTNAIGLILIPERICRLYALALGMPTVCFKVASV